MNGESWHELLFSVRRSIRYHDRRRSFFDSLNRWALFLSALSGTGAAVTVIGQSWKPLQIIFALLVTVFSLIDLILNTSQQARLHSDLYRKFVELERDMCLAEPTATDEIVRQLKARKLSIESDEPAVKTAVNLMCHNELIKAYGYDKSYLVKIGWLRRLSAHWIRQEGLSEQH